MAYDTWEVTATALHLRAQPDRTSASLLILRGGQRAAGLGEPRGGWVPLLFDGRSGFAAEAFLRRTAAAPPSPAPAPVAEAIDVQAKLRDPSQVHPRFRQSLQGVLEALQARELPFRVFEAYRHPERQDHLFAQGRTRPGGIVTKAGPWESLHQYGVAADLVLFVDGQWSWDDQGARKAQWEQMQAVAREAGLRTLSFERPHVELPVLPAELSDGSLLASGDESWRRNLAAAADRWRAAGRAGAPSMAEPERPPLPADGVS